MFLLETDSVVEGFFRFVEGVALSGSTRFSGAEEVDPSEPLGIVSSAGRAGVWGLREELRAISWSESSAEG